MRLKRLEVFGFKSFCEKTVVTFQPGITSIVGPNGCGKSNIVDAILWAMGEQSAKTLRGDRMEDVIFNGTAQRKPLSLAESTLTISGLKGELSASVAGYAEVEITRRLFRSGESEYLINRVPCRLKDIRDLLIDAGAGFKGHTVIEQGRIDQILQSSPVDRRAIIEEAAGILKYRVRKTEALRKLEATEQNLLRVRDIISEVRRQINALERQAQKAKKQAEILGEIRRIELSLLGLKYSGFKTSWEETSGAENLLAMEEAENLSRLSTQEALLQNHKLNLVEEEKELSRLRQELLEVEKEVHRQSGRSEILQNQSVSCAEQIERLRLEIREDQDQVIRMQTEGGQGAEDRENLGHEITRMQETLGTQESTFETMTATLHQAQKDLESARTHLFSMITGMTDIKNRQAAIQSRLDEMARRGDRISAERAETEQALLQTRSGIEENRIALEQAAIQVTEAQRDKESLLRMTDQMEENLTELHRVIASKKEELHRTEARYLSLNEIEKKLIGYQEGARSILLTRETNPEELPGIHGIVAHLVETQPAYERAIEAVLGERLQHIVVEDQPAARRAVSFLKKRGSGRGTFIPVHSEGGQATESSSSSTPRSLSGEGLIGPALDLVSFPAAYRDVVDHLLRNVFVVQNLDTAYLLREKFHNGEVWVTLDGEVLDSWGVISGGDNQGSLPNLIPKRREIKTLEKNLGFFKEELAVLEDDLAGKRAERDSLKSRREEQELGLRNMELRHGHQEKDLRVQLDEEKRLEHYLRTLELETREIGNSRMSLDKELEENQQILLEREAGLRASEQEIARFQTTQQEAARNWEEAQRDIMVVKTGLATREEKYQAMTSRLQETLIRQEALSNDMRQKEAEGVQLTEKKAGIAREIQQVHETLEELQKRVDESRQVTLRKEDVLADLGDRIRSADSELRTVRTSLEQVKTEKNKCDLKKVELRVEMDHIQEYLSSAYTLSIEECLRQIAEHSRNESLPLEEWNNRLNEEKERLNRLGPVNPGAIEEFQELQTRYDFLTRQESDLTEACDTLQKTIHKINQTTREMFLETFNTLNENFQKVFQSLFREGAARLVLTDETQVLESGIEIIAQPSGKKVNHLSLLSGGEKALTAIALLFASFLVRPTPFCVLDEIDAPLDEANTGRFLGALRSLTDRSQFIVITHNKRTMEAADMLYGITMEEPGSSKVVSVKLREAALA